MNQLIYEKNMDALRTKYPVWAKILEDVKRKKRNFDVMAEESLTGEVILKVNQEGRVLYLNGRYAPAAVIDRWFDRQGDIEEYAPIVIIGISNGEHIRRIIERAPKTSNILIYEPSFELFRRAMQEVDISFIFQPDIPVGIIVEGMNEYEMDAFFHFFISYDNMAFLRYYVSGNYQELFPEQVEDFVAGMKKYISDIHVSWDTVLRYANVRAVNVLANLPYLYEGYSMGELYGMLPEDIPVIIVSAGPSLNKNIMDLKKAVGKACIIATDTAMKPLLNAGIKPNLFVIVDGLKPELLFLHKDISKVPMVTMTAVSTEPMACHKGKKFFYYADSGFENEILKELGEKEGANRMLPCLMTGGSVATSAFSLALNMGARTVILVGQDLAMTGNRTHADGTFQDKMDEINTNSREYFEIEAADGGKVLTRADFKLYLEWFEKYIKEWDHITVVDATEGGALIHGSKIMTLKNAIKKYCKREFNVKWHIDHCKKLFVGENREIAINCFANSIEKLEEVKKKANEGLRYYERLEKLVKKHRDSGKELGKVLKKIKKLNHYMESDYMAQTVMDSLVGLNYTLRPLVYQMQEERADELLDVAAQGRVLLYGVTVAVDEIKLIAEKTVVEYAKTHMPEMTK
ncbi:MAG: motility associated factor glycosyltransferase family protein [Lachnospiraceae bacterium]|nr:motility associated factor glycosyltransferase family protein [Lachnospiraceae bacterium]